MHKKFKFYKINKFSKISLSSYKTLLAVPPLWHFVLIKKNKQNNNLFYFYSNNYYFFFPVTSYFLSLYYDSSSKCFKFIFFYTNNFYKIFWKLFKIIFSSFVSIFFKKLKFKGKGYYIYKNWRNTIAFRFGYSHIKRLFLFSSFVKFLSKTSVFIYGLNTEIISKLSFRLRSVRPINIFTGRGVRFNKQIVYRKTGKISSYR